MTRAASVRSRPGDAGLLERLLLGCLPAPDGGPPPALDAGRATLSTAVRGAIGFLAGAAAGLVLAFVAMRAPDVPGLLVGFGVGAIVGAAAAAVLLSRYPAVRRAGGVIVLAAPLLIVFAPFVLLGAGLVALRRWPRRNRRG